MKRTYQTRFYLPDEQASVLDCFAELSGKVERTLYGKTIAQGKAPESVKNDYLRRFSITSRQFNAICRPLKGKIKAIKELRKSHLTDLKSKIKKAETVVKKLSSQVGPSSKQFNKEKLEALRFKLHQKKRRLASLKLKLERIQADHKAGTVSLCFGSKKLFRAQHKLEINGHASHSEWRSYRNNDFYVLGSKDETAGCQGCVMTFDKDGQSSLRLRLPNSLVTAETKYVNIHVELNYGKDAILHALENNTAISYRFKRDSKGGGCLSR